MCFVQMVMPGLQILAAVVPVIPNIGSLLGALSAMLFRGVSGGDEGARDNSVMQQLQLQELTDEAGRVASAFEAWKCYMNDLSLKPSSKAIDHLVSKSVSWCSTKELGELLTHIKSQKRAVETTAKINRPVAKQILQQINVFCALSSLKELLLHYMMFLISNWEGCEDMKGTVNGLKNQIANQERENKRALKFLHRPKMHELSLASMYYPGQYPVIKQYLEYLGEPFPVPHPDHQDLRLSCGCCLRTDKVAGRTRRWVANIAAHFPVVGQIGMFIKSQITELKRAKYKPFFSFVENPGKEGLYRIIFQGDDDGDHLGVSGKLWRVLLTENGKGLISPHKHPDRFLYVMWDGDGATWEGDPGPHGYWLLDMRSGDEIIRSPTTPTVCEYESPDENAAYQWLRSIFRTKALRDTPT